MLLFQNGIVRRLASFAFILPLVFGMTAPAWAGDAEALQRLFDEAWEYDLQEDPLWATHVGDHRANDRLPDVTEAANRRRLAKKREFLKRLECLIAPASNRRTAPTTTFSAGCCAMKLPNTSLKRTSRRLPIVPAFTSNSPSCRRTCP